MKKKPRPTDKQRLDWLSKRVWQFYSADCFQLNTPWNGLSFARKTPRQAIDAAMRASTKP